MKHQLIMSTGDWIDLTEDEYKRFLDFIHSDSDFFELDRKMGLVNKNFVTTLISREERKE